VKRTKRQVQEGINEIKNIKSSEVPVAAVVVAAAVVQAIATVGVVQAVAQVAQVAVAVQVQALAVVPRVVQVAAVVANLVIVKQPRRKSVKIKKSTDKRIRPKIKN